MKSPGVMEGERRRNGRHQRGRRRGDGEVTMKQRELIIEGSRAPSEFNGYEWNGFE